jgi:hypothetical protein
VKVNVGDGVCVAVGVLVRVFVAERVCEGVAEPVDKIVAVWV